MLDVSMARQEDHDLQSHSSEFLLTHFSWNGVGLNLRKNPNFGPLRRYLRMEAPQKTCWNVARRHDPGQLKGAGLKFDIIFLRNLTPGVSRAHKNPNTPFTTLCTRTALLTSLWHLCWHHSDTIVLQNLLEEIFLDLFSKAGWKTFLLQNHFFHFGTKSSLFQ